MRPLYGYKTTFENSLQNYTPTDERVSMNNLYNPITKTRSRFVLTIFALAMFCYNQEMEANTRRGEALKEDAEDAEEKLQEAKQKAKQAAHLGKEGLEEEIEAAKEEAKDTAARVAQKTKATGHEIKEKVKDGAHTVKEKTQEGLANAADKAKYVAQKGKEKGYEVKEKVKEVASNALEATKNTAISIKDKTMDAVASVADKTKDAAQRAKSDDAARRVDTVYHKHGPAHDYTLPGDDGSEVDLNDHKGMVMLIVNIPVGYESSRQLDELETIYRRYAKRGFVVIGVLSNDFSRDGDADIATSSRQRRKGIPTVFPKSGLVHVVDKRGRYEACPLYKWLNEQTFFRIGATNGNFHKFLIGRDGSFIDWFSSKTSVTEKKVIKAIEKALAK